MTASNSTLTRLGGTLLLTVVLAGCATPKPDEGEASQGALPGTASSGTDVDAQGDSSAASGTSGGAATAGGEVKPAVSGASAKTTGRTPVKTTTGTRTTATKTEPAPDRDSAFGPKFSIDANGKVVPIKR